MSFVFTIIFLIVISGLVFSLYQKLKQLTSDTSHTTDFHSLDDQEDIEVSKEDFALREKAKKSKKLSWILGIIYMVIQIPIASVVIVFGIEHTEDFIGKVFFGLTLLSPLLMLFFPFMAEYHYQNGDYENSLGAQSASFFSPVFVWMSYPTIAIIFAVLTNLTLPL